MQTDFWTRITSLYGSLTSPVVLCMLNIVISIKITSLYGTQPSSVVFACKTGSWNRITTLYGSQTSPVVLCMKNIVINTRISSVYVSQSSSVAFACKQRILDQNYKYLWVPDLTCRFVHAKQRDKHQNY